MNDEERFLFDLEGYLVVRNALSPRDVAEINRIADERFPDDEPGRHGEWSTLPWGEPLKRLIDHPTIMPYLVELLGERVRLDHDYAIFMKQGESRGGLHGGTGGTHWYHYRNGRMSNGLTVVTWFLTPAPAGAGGFACVPASHKSNFDAGDIPEEVRSFERPAPYVVQPAVEAGDALIFTEAVIHGTMAWRSPTERRALLFKYSPGHSSWARDWYGRFDPGELSPRQRRMLAPPSVEGHEAVVQPEGPPGVNPPTPR